MSHEAKILIVDEHDNPVGAATRPEVWGKGLIHRIVHIVVVDDQNHILLQKRTPNMRLWPNCWTVSAGGHVDEGEEDWLAAAQREAQEEIGLKDIPLEEIGMFYHDSAYEHKILKRFNKVFRAVVEHGTEFSLQEEEVATVQWFTTEEARRLPQEQITPTLHKILTEYL